MTSNECTLARGSGRFCFSTISAALDALGLAAQVPGKPGHCLRVKGGRDRWESATAGYRIGSVWPGIWS